MAKGVKIRSRLQDTIAGENISTYLIAKQKDLASRKIITSIITEDNIELHKFKEIIQYAGKFFKKLYSKLQCNPEKQNHFSSFIQNELNDPLNFTWNSEMILQMIFLRYMLIHAY